MLSASSDINVISLALCILILSFSYTIFGITGFGQNAISVPFLLLFVPLKFGITLVVLLDTVFVSWGAMKFNHQANFKELTPMLPAVVIGLVLGAISLSFLPEHILLLSLGAFIVCYAAYGFVCRQRIGRISRLAAAPIGLVGGLFSAAFGTGGPIHIIYITGRMVEKNQIRASILIISTLAVIARLVAFGYSGFFNDRSIWIWWACALPFCLIGVRLGHRMHNAVNDAIVLNAIRALLLLSGGLLIFRNLKGL